MFLRLTEMSDEAFWKRFFAAHSMRVTGDFSPGSADIELKNSEVIIPLLRDCAKRYLSGIELPF